MKKMSFQDIMTVRANLYYKIMQIKGQNGREGAQSLKWEEGKITDDSKIASVKHRL